MILNVILWINYSQNAEYKLNNATFYNWKMVYPKRQLQFKRIKKHGNSEKMHP